MSDVILAARGVHRVYKNAHKEVRAVNGVSLEIEKGKSLAIVGPSGAGKSTLLHLLGGLDRPTSGKVTMDERDIYGLSDRERARIRNERVGFVFQFYHLLPEFTALENVMLPALMSRRTSAERSGASPNGTKTRDRAEEVMKAVGLAHRENHRPGELSGGEAQRVAIARALVNGPKVLLCDEPTGNLDSKSSESIYGLLFGLKSKSGMALVIVTHDEEISKMADRTIRIKDGKII